MLLVYDHECPVCPNYCQAVRIREAAGELQIINARGRSDSMQEITDRGLDIDPGMRLKLDDQLEYGNRRHSLPGPAQHPLRHLQPLEN